jgi:hypothetical protein
VLTAEFPYGILLVTDATSTEPIPSWDSAEEQVAVAGSALVVRVRHADEGEVTVRVQDAPADVSGGLIFTGEIAVPSGWVRPLEMVAVGIGNAGQFMGHPLLLTVVPLEFRGGANHFMGEPFIWQPTSTPVCGSRNPGQAPGAHRA